MLPDSVPADWQRPDVAPDGTVSITMRLLEAVIDHAAMVFRHYADDDFDGTADAVVVEQFDSTFTMFVGNFVVARRAPGSARVGEAWAFRRAITDTLRVLAPDSTGTIRIPAIVSPPGAAEVAPGAKRPVVEGTESADERLGFGTQVFAAVNQAAGRCGPEKGRIRAP